MSSLPRNATEYRAWWSANTDVPYGTCWCGCGENTGIAAKSAFKRFCVRGEPRQYVSGHNMQKPSQPFYAEEDRGYRTPCWVWQRKLGSNGYAEMSYQGRTHPAHRLFYERKFGPVPAGLELDHLCRARSCVNPEHLEPVSHAENSRRGIATKLTRDKVEEIRRRHCIEGLTYAALGRLFGITAEQVSNIVKRKQWV